MKLYRLYQNSWVIKFQFKSRPLWLFESRLNATTFRNEEEERIEILQDILDYIKSTVTQEYAPNKSIQNRC